ncbi:MAG TPA: DNA translocase FtsK 4TM domain-containing protein, partial [Candidatus Eisenbacteria bacterium]
MAPTISSSQERFTLALLLGAFALLALASLATFQPPLPFAGPWTAPNACGPVGALLAFGLVWALGRMAAFGVPLLSGAWAWNRLRDNPSAPLTVRSLLGGLVIFEVCALLGLGGLDRWAWSGGWGFAASLALRSALGSVGSWVVGGALFGITLVAASEFGFHWIGRLARGLTVVPVVGVLGALRAWRERQGTVGAGVARSAPRRVRAARPSDARAEVAEPRPRPRITGLGADGASPAAAREEDQLALPLPLERRASPRPKPKPASARTVERTAAPAIEAPAEALPSLALLAMPPQQEDLITAADLTAEASLLVAKLADFGIEGRVTEIHPGPVITTFEFEPAAGVKVNQIVSREDDLALALRAQRIRILAPIPGKGAVGVEIPNRRRRTVYLREVLSSSQYETDDAALKVPLGVDVVGQPFVTDLTRMPHVLVAGATGSGKSVCLNAIITGLLFQHDPKTLQMVMIDPKMLELSAYNGIPHLVMPVVTEAKRASRALRWVVSEMEKRYKLMATCGARNIAAYNDRVAAGQVPAGPASPDGTASAPPERLSYVMVVIDELADLMLTAPAEIEEPIARLAQMARAVGIHIILATQRPSVDVITGLIKANMPSRVSFHVASKVDSRTILDRNGADKLLGKGDMLYLAPGTSNLVRAQGTFISDREIREVVKAVREQAEPQFNSELTRFGMASATESSTEDDLYEPAVRIILESQRGSVTLLQRQL